MINQGPALALYGFGWASGGDLGDPSRIATALDRARLPGGTLVEGADTPAVKEVLAPLFGPCCRS